jgi:hypothetical protein
MALRIFACSPFNQTIEAVALNGLTFAGDCITTTSQTRVGPCDFTSAIKSRGCKDMETADGRVEAVT